MVDEKSKVAVQLDLSGRKVVLPAHVSVKQGGKFVGWGWRKETKFGACLVIRLDERISAGGWLLVTARQSCPDALGRT